MKASRDPWLSLLKKLDAAAREDVRLDCMGGFVVTTVYGFSRPTGDLDVLEIAPRECRPRHARTRYAGQCAPQEVQDLS